MYNKLLFGFVSSDTRVVIYVKQEEFTNNYCVKVMNKDGTKTIVRESNNLLSIMESFTEVMANFTDGFTKWSPL